MKIGCDFTRCAVLRPKVSYVLFPGNSLLVRTILLISVLPFWREYQNVNRPGSIPGAIFRDKIGL